MKTRKEVLDALALGKNSLATPFKVESMALFCSWAQGDNESDSDVDVLVEVDPSIGLGFVTLTEQLEQLIGLKVDLVSRRAIKPNFWKEIEPELIYV